MATDNHEEIRAWGWLLSELKSIAQREGVEVTLDDEDLYITEGWKDSRAENPRRAVHLRFVNSEDPVNS